ncbi:zinc finger protein Xfin-like [Lutzomyia longipalpis]|uniref:C2h2-type zn-finger protein n=1 Tax=Lutzomyia longipalpis TaxID=7200 RepID=A0A1B0CGD0_LUTLO|nr:zinc finger protein Xfin-like [Lutzomyia longipalpis]
MSEINNFPRDICRICEDTKFLINIMLPENQHLYRKLSEIEGIQLDQDHENYEKFHTVYKFICTACENNLEGMYEFWSQCINTRKKLTELQFGKIQGKDEKGFEMEVDVKTEDPFEAIEPIEAISPSDPLSSTTMPIDPIDIKDEEEDVDEYEDYQVQSFPEEEHREFIEILQSHHIYEMDIGILPTKQSPAKKFPCPYCEKSFNKKMTLDRHRVTHQQDKHLCVQCEMRCEDRKSLIRHILWDHEKLRKHYCQKCNRMFASEDILKTHMATHITPKRYKHTCPVCTKTFVRLGILEDHIKAHKSQGVDVEGEILRLARKAQMEFVPESQRRKMCDKCGEMYTDPKAYRRKKNPTSEEIACCVCLEKFKSLDDLKSHLDVHMTSKPFKCDLCHKEFKHKHKMGYHRLIHTGNKQFLCGYCEYGFTRSFELTNHLKLCHADQIPNDSENDSTDDSTTESSVKDTTDTLEEAENGSAEKSASFLQIED